MNKKSSFVYLAAAIVRMHVKWFRILSIVLINEKLNIYNNSEWKKVSKKERIKNNFLLLFQQTERGKEKVCTILLAAEKATKLFVRV